MSKNTLTIVVPFVLFGLSTPALAGVLSVQPASQNEANGQTFFVNIAVANVSDLYALEFDLAFNPQVIQATGITEGAFLPTGGPTFFLPGTIDNVFGSITFNGDTLLGPVSGVSGSGMLAIATFQAIGNGVSAIAFDNLFFLDSTGGSIAVTA